MTDHSQKLFETLVRHNEVALVVYLRTMVRDPGLVDDLFQETLITAWNRFDQYDQTRPLGPWLRGIAMNLARNAARKRKRDCQIYGEAMQVEVEAAIERLDDQLGFEKSEALNDCLTQLTERSRELLRRRYEENLNASMIAECMRTSAAAVRKQLQRIRASLAECVAKKMAGSAG